MAIDFDPTNQQYINAVNTLQAVRSNLVGQVPTLKKMSKTQLKWVLQRHPLLKEVLRLARDSQRFLAHLKEEL